MRFSHISWEFEWTLDNGSIPDSTVHLGQMSSPSKNINFDTYTYYASCLTHSVYKRQLRARAHCEWATAEFEQCDNGQGRATVRLLTALPPTRVLFNITRSRPILAVMTRLGIWNTYIWHIYEAFSSHPLLTARYAHRLYDKYLHHALFYFYLFNSSPTGRTPLWQAKWLVSDFKLYTQHHLSHFYCILPGRRFLSYTFRAVVCIVYLTWVPKTRF